MDERRSWNRYISENKALWDRRVDTHIQSALYDQKSFLNGKSSLTEIEANALGRVTGKSLLHLQCHFGQDSLSWARLGAQVTGIDFSEQAIHRAKEINKQLRLNASFIVSEVYRLPEVLNEKFDIVFSSYGAIPWLPDLNKWARIVSNFLKPDGIFYLAEFHPTLYLFNFETRQVEYGYFGETDPYEEDVHNSYADPHAILNGREYCWNHSLAEVVNPLLENGLQLKELNEYDFSPYKTFPNMTEREPGRYVWGNFGIRIPHVFSIKMRKS